MPTAAKESKVPFGPNQELKDAVLVDVVESKEPWAEYQLSDGASLKTKSVLFEIWRVKDEYDQEGNPMYVIKSGHLVNINAPDALKKKP